MRASKGWFFYKPGVEYLTQRDVSHASSDDPVAAICDFRDQLAARGIQLVVMPAPNKESIYPQQLSRRAESFSTAICESTQSLLRQSARTPTLEVVNLFELYGRQKASDSYTQTSISI